jgi:RNA polymerase sigma-70 factor, ECF subfamily
MLAPADQLEKHRAELTAFCHRMLGSRDAEDAVQETFIRALRGFDGFEGRGTLRGWLYRIARNVCLDMLKNRERRASPIDLSPGGEVLSTVAEAWIEPVPPEQLAPTGDPAQVAESRETVRRAFAAVLRHLSPNQRAVLILREVLRWQASEVAELFGTSVASVNSALQRARATLELRRPAEDGLMLVDAANLELLDRYISAFERYDVVALTQLVYEDAGWVGRPLKDVA